MERRGSLKGKISASDLGQRSQGWFLNKVKKKKHVAACGGAGDIFIAAEASSEERN